jgi:hypothetical protein
VRRSTAIAAIAALFLIGVLVGVLGTHLFYLRQIRQPGGLARLGAHLMVADLQRRLALDPDQRRQVEAILADATHETAAVRREMTPRVLAILDRSRERISAVLTPEQRRELERYRHAHSERLRHLLLSAP